MAKTQTTNANLTVKIIANDGGNLAGKLADAEPHVALYLQTWAFAFVRNTPQRSDIPARHGLA